jgi:hypothetical protein
MIYEIRHQHGGFSGIFFAAEPTPEQLAPVKRYLDAVHAGRGEGWIMAVPREVIGAEIPVMPSTPQERAGGGGLPAPMLGFGGQGRVF